MQWFPQGLQGHGVTLANWQEPPYNRWAFSNLDQVVPVQPIWPAANPFAQIHYDPQPLGQIPVQRVNGAHEDVDAVLADTYTDALVVIQDGTTVFERYSHQTARTTPHLLMSITKSFVGCVAGRLVDLGWLNPNELVTHYIPELASSGYAGATVRNVLDMRSGIHFSEEYTNPNAEVRVMEEAFGWRPHSGRPGVPKSTYDYLVTLRAATPHGGTFDYRSCETLVLGWLCERAAGQPMADLITQLIWIPMGAEHRAQISCDPMGTAIHDGGMCATASDLARFGLMLLNDGHALGNQIVPTHWLRDGWAPGYDVIDAFARSSNAPHLPGGWYRNQFWYLPREHGVVMLGLGIYGQMLYINPTTKTVAAKLSTWPEAQSPWLLHDTLRAFDAISGRLAYDRQLASTAWHQWSA